MGKGNFAEDFKRDAVLQITEGGYRVAEVLREARHEPALSAPRLAQPINHFAALIGKIRAATPKLGVGKEVFKPGV